MKSLDDLLAKHEAPQPSDMLKARILREAKAQRAETALPQPANDNRWKKWGAIAAAALFMGVVGFSTLMPSTEVSEADLWADTAQDLGYDDLYAWVNDEGETEDDTRDQSSLQVYIIPA